MTFDEKFARSPGQVTHGHTKTQNKNFVIYSFTNPKGNKLKNYCDIDTVTVMTYVGLPHSTVISVYITSFQNTVNMALLVMHQQLY